VSFTAPRFFLKNPTYCFFVLLIVLFDVKSKNLLPNLQHADFSLILSSRSCIVLYSRFRTIIHLELIFKNKVWGVVCSSFWNQKVQMFLNINGGLTQDHHRYQNPGILKSLI
jgi:hypothetical protein